MQCQIMKTISKVDIIDADRNEHPVEIVCNSILILHFSHPFNKHRESTFQKIYTALKWSVWNLIIKPWKKKFWSIIKYETLHNSKRNIECSVEHPV